MSERQRVVANNRRRPNKVIQFPRFMAILKNQRFLKTHFNFMVYGGCLLAYGVFTGHATALLIAESCVLCARFFSPLVIA